MVEPIETTTVHLRVRRTSGWQNYAVQVSPDAYVMDAIEAAGANDASLLYRHSCHHASCGSCGIRINGREALPCITPIAPLTARNRTLRLEPLRNFPIIGDLLVDLGPFMRRLDSIGMPLLREAEGAHKIQSTRLTPSPESTSEPSQSPAGFRRFENCVECGLCVSACPIAGLDAQYAGPAALAAAARTVAEQRQTDGAATLRLIDDRHGAWRCHAAFECSEVCPAGVDPAGKIMYLRKQLLHSPASRDSKGGA